MKFTLLAATGFLALPAFATQVPEGALLFNVKRTTQPVSEENRLKVRADFDQSVEDKINNQKFYYSTTVEIGTPPQEVEVLIDTGSSDTWVMSPQSKFNGQGEAPKSFFDPTKSSTWQYNGTDFSIKYGIGHTSGKWGTDVIRIGDAEVQDLSIGIADVTDVRQGIIGIGRPQAEITNLEKRQYSNLPQKLYESGKINSPAYSLYLNSENAETGSILFGAVDHSKYTGKLVSLAISHPAHYGITLNGIRATGRADQNVMSNPMTAVLDSGTTFSYFPDSVMRSIYEVLNANPNFTINEKYYTDCNITDSLILDFGSTQIKVPNYQFLTPITKYVNSIVASVAFPQNSCYVGLDFLSGGGDYILLGDNLIRSAYIVYDSQNGRISLAQANFDTTAAPNIELLSSH